MNVGWWLGMLLGAGVCYYTGWSVGVRRGMRAGAVVRQLPPGTVCTACGDTFGPWSEPQHYDNSGLVLQVRQCAGCGLGEEREVEVR